MDPKYAANYERLFRQHWWWRSREKLLLKQLESMSLPRQGNVLDVGCGGGWGFERLSQFGTVFGVEIDESLVAASMAHRDRIYVGPFDRCYQPERIYSLIVMLDVLEHMADPHEALAHAANLLEPRGNLLITVPAMPALWTKHDEMNHHYVRYTKSSLQTLVQEAGFIIDRLQYFFHWLVPLKLLVRSKEAIFQNTPQPPSVPHWTINSLFLATCQMEQCLFRKFPLPFGSSLLCACHLK